ncbi:MAG: hypothetical protein WC508_01625 [Patescibacteria group bacterium]
MVERENRPKPIKEQLRATLKSADIVDFNSEAEVLKDLQLFEIIIKDREQWESKEEAEKILDFFGDAVVRIYDDKTGPDVYDGDNPQERSRVLTDNIINADIGRADRIVVVADQNNRLVSFLASETYNYPDQPKLNSVSYLSLAYTDLAHRNKGICQELVCQHFNQEDFNAFGALSATPAMAESYSEACKRMGLKFYFGGHKNGSLAETGPDDELEKCKIFAEELDDLNKDDYLVKGVTPPLGYQVFQRESAMAPIESSDIAFKNDKGPLAQLFKEELLEIQQKYSPNTVYGILFALKQETNQ